jgi:hypothetical protein
MRLEPCAGGRGDEAKVFWDRLKLSIISLKNHDMYIRDYVVMLSHDLLCARLGSSLTSHGHAMDWYVPQRRVRLCGMQRRMLLFALHELSKSCALRKGHN